MHASKYYYVTAKYLFSNLSTQTKIHKSIATDFYKKIRNKRNKRNIINVIDDSNN